MGTYTEIVLAVKLKKKLPQQVPKVLRYMIENYEDNLYQPNLPDHPFFQCHHWSAVLLGGSAYFPGDSMSTLRFDDHMQAFFLTARANLKNYDNEIELFCKWLAPHVDTEGFAGYINAWHVPGPTLIYFLDGRAVFHHCGTLRERSRRND